MPTPHQKLLEEYADSLRTAKDAAEEVVGSAAGVGNSQEQGPRTSAPQHYIAVALRAGGASPGARGHSQVLLRVRSIERSTG